MKKEMKRMQMFLIKNGKQLDNIEKEFRSNENLEEFMPWASHDTSYREIAENIIKDQDGDWAHPLILVRTRHNTGNSINSLCKKSNEYVQTLSEENKTRIDILSICGEMDNTMIMLNTLVRSYGASFNFKGFFDFIGEDISENPDEEEDTPVTGKLILPDEVKNFHLTEEEKKAHKKAWDKQEEILDGSDFEHPFLNSIDDYIPKEIPNPIDSIDPVYDLLSVQKKMETVGSYQSIINVFNEIMNFCSGTEYYHYVQVMKGEITEESFMEFIEQHLRDSYVNKGLMHQEDIPVMKKMIYKALFKLYVVQDLIDDPEVTDIKITAPDAIRVRVKGRAYISNVTFVDKFDYIRFINGIAIRNGILQTVPEQTFTDKHDENYVLRFTISAQYVNSDEWPYLHIRKVARKKPLGDDLIKLGMFTPKIRDYLLDCGKHSRGVVFAGPPGSGKTVCLNWFLEEAYEQSAEVLVIQENDELFAYRKGIMFQHVVNYDSLKGEAINLEQLGQLALVAGANVFIIGEAKGAEICSAITLSNSGCRTAITIHSPSSTETINKMADLAQRGYAQSLEMAKRSLTSFQTIVYLDKFKVREISEITGFDEKTKDMTYRYIYRDMSGEEWS